MSTETVLHHLQRHPALSQASAESLQRFAQQAEVLNVPAGQTVATPAQQTQRFFLLLEGQARLHDEDQDLTLRLEPGAWMGYGTRASLHGSAWGATATTATRWLSWAPEHVDQLCQANPALGFYIAYRKASEGPATDHAIPTGAASPHSAASMPPEPASARTTGWLSAPVRALLRSGTPVCIGPEASIQEAARLMAERRVSSLLLMEKEQLQAVVTDRDLRNRVVAQGLDIQRPVADIATFRPLTVDIEALGFDAMLLMAQHHIHHLPVLEGGRPVGVLTANDLSEHRQASAVFLVRDIQRQTTLEGLQAATAAVGRLQHSLAAGGATALSIGRILTAITDAVTVRLLQLGHERLGPAPVPYVWVAAGSQARREQTAKSDQDNCLILDDAYQPQAHGAYFEALSRWVCDGLNACGYVHCPGQMMAMTPTWRQPLRQWRAYFEQWIRTPEPKSLMLTSVFFDQRAVWGEAGLLESLRRGVLAQTRGNSLFLAHMVGNALKHQPPLGLFGQITLSKGGEHPGTIDLKHSGTVPIIDLARVYALAGGAPAVNTDERLAQAAQSREITPEKARDLRDAFELMASLRVAHQARQVAAGQKPDNFLSLDELSHLERSHLKDAFGVVKSLQNVLQQRYGGLP